jgi:hypothetical protein
MDPSCKQDHPDRPEGTEHLSIGQGTTAYVYDPSGRMVACVRPGSGPHEQHVTIEVGEVPDAPLFSPCEASPPAQVDHDCEKRLYRIKGPDGQTEVFRDSPVRFLILRPDPETGEPKPVIRFGQPEYLYLCREEREPR